jgi:hypothetical protein
MLGFYLYMQRLATPGYKNAAAEIGTTICTTLFYHKKNGGATSSPLGITGYIKGEKLQQ